jgi:hypothetical protein
MLAEKAAQRLVLIDRQELAIAQRPVLRREVEAEHPDLAEKRLHVFASSRDGIGW